MGLRQAENDRYTTALDGGLAKGSYVLGAPVIGIPVKEYLPVMGILVMGIPVRYYYSVPRTWEQGGQPHSVDPAFGRA